MVQGCSTVVSVVVKNVVRAHHGEEPVRDQTAMSTNRKREPVLLSVTELAAVADAIRPQRLKALVLLSAWGALRFGEATELRRKDIGEGAESVTVSRGVTHRNGCNIGTTSQTDPVLPPHIRGDIQHHLDSFVAGDPDALLPIDTRCVRSPGSECLS